MGWVDLPDEISIAISQTTPERPRLLLETVTLRSCGVFPQPLLNLLYFRGDSQFLALEPSSGLALHLDPIDFLKASRQFTSSLPSRTGVVIELAKLYGGVPFSTLNAEFLLW